MSPRAKRLTLLLVGSAVGIIFIGFLAGVIAGFWSAHDDAATETALFWTLGAFAVFAMVASLVVGAVWMRSIDEAAREAHKAAWYWGGTAGMSAGGVLIILTSLPQAERFVFASWLDGRTDPSAYAATGALAMLLLMMIGYAIVWAWWWLARR